MSTLFMFNSDFQNLTKIFKQAAQLDEETMSLEGALKKGSLYTGKMGRLDSEYKEVTKWKCSATCNYVN